MREILFRGQYRRYGEKVRMDGTKLPSKWVYGGVLQGKGDFSIIYGGETEDSTDVGKYPVYTDTLGQYTGLTDKNGKKIFEGDIVEYNTYDDFDCYSIVKIGEYKQDGSDGEYSTRKCCGVYVEVDNFTCPDWADNDPLYFKEYLLQQNLAEVNEECEVIGNIHDNPNFLIANIHDNPELLKGEE